uniref:EF-hand domain family member D1 n=1 Tax=Equus caballus TaxID=9796 RepID=A0A9L0TLB1_HORSE
MHLLLLPMKGAGQLAPAAGVPRETFCILQRAALVLLPPRGGPGVCEPDCGQEGLKNSRRRGTMKADLVARGPQPWVSASLSPMVGAGGLHLKSMDPLASGVQRSMVALGHGWLLLSARTRLQSSPAPHQSACRLHLWAGTRWYDAGRDGFIDLMELKLMMEKLGAPQTHLGLKSMIKEVDEDFDGKLSFREFLLIFHKAAAGELQEDSGLMALAKLSEINVALEGVKGAKDFFEAKVQALSSASKFEAELKAEQDERKQEEEKRRLRQAAFRELKAAFSA